MKKTFSLLLAIFAFVLLSSNSFARTAQTGQSPIEQLKKSYEIRDFRSGFENGKKFVENDPQNPGLQAWFILNFAHYEPNDAIVYAKDLSEKNKDNAWADFAYAYALKENRKAKDALPIAEKILKDSPENEDFIVLKTSVLFWLDKNSEALDFLEKNADSISDKPKFFRLRGELLYYVAKAEKADKADEVKKRSFDSFSEALKIAPENVDALYFSGAYLNREKRYAEAAQNLKKAVRLSPDSVSIRREFWRTIVAGESEKIPPAKQKELNAAINDFLKKAPDSSKSFYAAYQTYRDTDLTKEKLNIEKNILTRFPASSETENLLVDRIHDFSYVDKNDKPIEKKRGEVVKMLTDFLNRPKHFNLSNLESMYWKLFYTVKDFKAFSGEEVLKYAEKAVSEKRRIGAGFYPSLVDALLERDLLAEAETYARQGEAATEEDLKTRNDWAKDELVRADFDKRARNEMNGAFGKVLFKQKKYDEAEALLVRTESFQTLGEMYVAQNKMDKAEDAYISFLANAYRQEGAWKILKDFYQKRNGNLNGYDKFEEKVKRLEAEKRREKIVADKLKTPKDIIPFELKDISGKPINFAELKGRIVVINVWGTWCNPCVIEMPEFQQLYKKYADDKDVAIVTIAEDNLDSVKKFMTEKKYDFPVMMGEGYLSQTGVNVFPTTWFVDKTGKISYIKISSSPKLLEEFSWRIEALR